MQDMEREILLDLLQVFVLLFVHTFLISPENNPPQARAPEQDPNGQRATAA
jgi:hypothetical protein